MRVHTADPGSTSVLKHLLCQCQCLTPDIPHPQHWDGWTSLWHWSYMSCFATIISSCQTTENCPPAELLKSYFATQSNWNKQQNPAETKGWDFGFSHIYPVPYIKDWALIRELCLGSLFLSLSFPSIPSFPFRNPVTCVCCWPQVTLDSETWIWKNRLRETAVVGRYKKWKMVSCMVSNIQH